jgi:hypothetical protein
MSTIVCTLFEGDYHLGLGALVNSLASVGYAGEVRIGYRNVLPPWITQLKQDTDGSYAAGSIRLQFVSMSDSRHLAVQKAGFLLSILEAEPDCEKVVYFDPDIVVRGRWGFFDEWTDCGVALCQDVSDAFMASDHPIRRSWARWAGERGLEVRRLPDRYFNSGFVGVRREHRDFLEAWSKVLKLVAQDGHVAENVVRNRSLPFATWDQDAMNLAVMLCETVLSTLGQEGMDFAPGGYTMAHAVGRPKPWRKQFFVRALNGIQTSSADKGWLANTKGPIRVLNSGTRFWKGIDLKLGALTSRFVSRR